LRDRIVHHVETGIASDDHLIGVDFEEFGEQALGFGEAVNTTVVADIQTGGSVKIVLSHDRQHPVGDIELLRSGFPPGHIEGEILLLECGDAFVQALLGFQRRFLLCLQLLRMYRFITKTIRKWAGAVKI
jgi:hypothetical protein